MDGNSGNDPAIGSMEINNDNKNDDSNESSLTLSLTPPVLDEEQNTHSSISEHLQMSAENDRSMQEIDVELSELDLDYYQANRGRSQPSSVNNTSSIISLNGLDTFIAKNLEAKDNVSGILEEILTNQQFKSDESSLDIFANVDLSDAMMNSYNNQQKRDFNLSQEDEVRKMRSFEELLAAKDNTIAQLNTELDSFRELLSYPSSNSTTEYKAFQEEHIQKHLTDFQSALMHKDEQIEKLTQNLQQSILNREEMKQHFKNELAQVQEKLRETSDLLKIQRDVPLSPKRETNSDIYKKLVEKLGNENVDLLEMWRKSIQKENDEKNRQLIEEIGMLKSKIEADRVEFDEEMSRLKILLSKDVSDEIRIELDAKHNREMEELRTYFEKKCADLEKNYSEEVFSQHSRKLSNSSSTCSEISADIPFTQPGPGGDAQKAQQNLSILDFELLKSETRQIAEILEQQGDVDFEKAKKDIFNLNLKNIFVKITKEKHQAEMELLKDDFDSRLEQINLEWVQKIESMQNQIDSLNHQLETRIVAPTMTTSQQEVANSGEFEIDEVVQSYERRLQEQVTMAKIDIIGALEAQIQRLANMDNIDDDWPPELLQLKARFSEKYETQMGELRASHEEQIARLKEENLKNLNSALDRARKRRNSLNSLNSSDVSYSNQASNGDVIKERDAYKKQTLALRNLLGELLKYFTQCEDELNNTLVDEIINKQMNRDEECPSNVTMQRVHLTPNFAELMNLIDNKTDLSSNSFESIDLKSELDECLEKLKSDANAILAMTNNLSKQEDQIGAMGGGKNVEHEMSSLTRKLISETQQKNALIEKLKESEAMAENLEIDRNTLENQMDQLLEKQKILEVDLVKAREKISELIENGHREIVSEGYGEDGSAEIVCGLNDAIKHLNNLQEQARAAASVVKSANCGLDGNLLLNLIEDLARAGERIVEEAKKDHDDLKQQIASADKKYKLTCQFLEEQAAEREQERDEAQKEIDKLKISLKIREKDRESCERITNEIEVLEAQIRNYQQLNAANEQRAQHFESEYKEAVDKIYELRDIIRSLEDQLKTRQQSEDELRETIDQLELYVRQQVRTPDSERGWTASGTGSEKNRAFDELIGYVRRLEDEVQQFRLNRELIGGEDVVRQIKNQLTEFETTLEKRTKDIETMYTNPTNNNTTCSSPSEDISLRDVKQSPPAASLTSAVDECEVPLQQLSRLKEKLIRHSRAEDAALKRIRDLEMELIGLRMELDGCQNERDMLQRQNSEHLVLISNLQIRLDEQRMRAEHIEKQTNTSLEVQNYDLKNALNSLEEKVGKKDKQVAQLKNDLIETKKMLCERDKELEQCAAQESKIIAEMQQELERLRGENSRLKKEMDELNLSENDLREIEKLRLTGLSFHDIFNLTNEEQMRRATSSRIDIQQSFSFPPGGGDGRLFEKNRRNNTVLESEGEISRIERVSAPKSMGKHVRFEDDVRESVEKRDEEKLSKEMEEKVQQFKELEDKLENLQRKLDETEVNLEKATKEFEQELKNHEKLEEELKMQMSKNQNEMDEKLEKLNTKLVQSESSKVKLENQIVIQNKQLKEMETEKMGEIQKGQHQIQQLSKEITHFQHLIAEKDKIITQMSEDSKSLHVNLETIQAKLTETGNIIDLAKRLRDEQKRNADLTQELHQLKAQLLLCGDRKELDEVTDQLQKELDYSVQLDSHLLNAIDNNGSGGASLEDFDDLKLALKKQKSINKHLTKSKEFVERQREDLERKLEETKFELVTLRNRLCQTQRDNAKLIEELRLSLDGVLDNEVKFKSLLEGSEKERAVLQNQLKEMQTKIKSLNSQSNEANSGSSTKEIYLIFEQQLKTIETDREYLREQLRQAKIMMTLKEEELRKSDAKIKLLNVNENLMKDRLDQLQSAVMTSTQINKEIESERDRLLLKLNNLKLESGAQAVPEKLMLKIKELRGAVNDNMQMVELVTRLTSEKKRLEERIQKLENRTANSNVADEMPFDDPTERANYLFAKYLRIESYRKNLMWQKRYLLSLLNNYRFIEEQIVVANAQIVNNGGVRKGLARFRRVAIVLISIQRMKWLVKRWHSGKRITKDKYQEYKAPSLGQCSNVPHQRQAQFHVGLPVSSLIFQNDLNTTPNSAFNETLPLFGDSPPSKDAHILTRNRVEQVPLASPAILNRYFDRFKNIQDKLGLDQ